MAVNANGPLVDMRNFRQMSPEEMRKYNTHHPYVGPLSGITTRDESACINCELPFRNRIHDRHMAVVILQ